MPDIYDRAKALATRMLAPRSKGGKGLELVLRRETLGEYDPDAPQAPSELVLNGSGFREEYDNKYIDDTLIVRGDVKLLVSPVQLSGADMPTPLSNDRIQFDGTTYTVIAVGPWNYAGLAVGFELQVRK
ncbi:hypothetical protein HBR94_14475 [Pseudomonas sp. WS 5412]|uniref:hypothetical protein n=1 Tax=unclassified Pseudomonas TaxID=196821 RepID=UPI001473EAFB|nr:MULTISPECIES: hypothetical protein [unclassified Pseudomonas]NMY32705.1 hypothetical protein [Pseudomonas sp. WS 5412]WLI32868.1 hypothetical protein PSH80_16565 [Pseudomonas sp. FP818]